MNFRFVKNGHKIHCKRCYSMDDVLAEYNRIYKDGIARDYDRVTVWYDLIYIGGGNSPDSFYCELTIEEIWELFGVDGA